MWDAQVEALAPHFRVLRFDTRGHGASSASPGDYTIEQLGRDVLALADALGIRQFAFCGLSLGGMVGQWLAVHAAGPPDAPRAGQHDRACRRPAAMEARRTTVLDSGMAAVVDTVMARFFTPASLERNPPRGRLGPPHAARHLRRRLCRLLRRDSRHGSRAALGRITTPTLVIGGDHDVSMPWPDHGALLAASIPGATVVQARGRTRLEPRSGREASCGAVRFPAAEADDDLSAGIAARRAVLGDAHVDRSAASTTDFTRDFPGAHHAVRVGHGLDPPGLDHRTRRLLVLAITASMGRWEEFRLHLGAGLAHELEWPDIEEVLLQTAVYAGVPAANTGFQIAAEHGHQRGLQPCQSGAGRPRPAPHHAVDPVHRRSYRG